MAASASSGFSRRLLLWTVIFGIFVLCDLALFGWLIFRSLSRQEIERVVLEARSEAEELARQIAGGVEERGLDLYTAIATESETQTYIDSVLAQREIVERVEILDREGRVVFRSERTETQGDASDPESDLPLEIRRFDRETPYERVEVPVGEVGTFVIGISSAELRERLEVLRRELLRQASVIAGLTVVLFGAAYLLVWRFLRRTRRLEEQTQEAERMAYVGTLAAGLAHEIRSPLNSLNLNMQMLEEEFQQGGAVDSQRRLTSITRSEISRLERLVTDFLSYARPPRFEPRPVAAMALLEHVAEVMRGRLETHGVRLRLVDHGDDARVAGDREQLSQLLINLVDNAIQACRVEPTVELGVRREDGSVVLWVADNGIGLGPEDRERMFELFFSKRKGGTGLGLAIVERIAAAHGGELRVESALGKGTRVELWLPESAGAAEPLEPTGAPVGTVAELSDRQR